MKFKAGDKVRVIGPKLTTDSIAFSLTGVMWVESMMNEIGKVHVIKRVVNRVGYKIDDGLDYTYSEEWLEPIADKTEQKPKRTLVIEITDDGATGKYIVGKKIKRTASIKRYHKDKPNDYRAAIFAVGKLFGRDLKITEAGVSLSADEVRKMKDSLKNAQGYLDDAKMILERNAAEK